MPVQYRSPAGFDPDRFVLQCRDRSLDCRPGLEARVMGILNVTPDSFYDGGRFVDVDSALRRVEEMVREDASVIDVGGESSRPAGSAYGRGAVAVSAVEEIRRVRPVVEMIASRFPEAVISVDTWKPEVARAALEAGAHVVNDVTGLRYTEETAAVAAEYSATLVVMHSVGKPGGMSDRHRYEDVVSEVRDSLAASVQRAESAGVRHLVVDPGFGFGKTPQENLLLIRGVHTFLELNRPVLIGVSRKSTVGVVLGRPGAPVPPEQRLNASLGITAVGVLGGASIVRTHDVRPTVEMLKGMAAVLAAERRPSRHGDGYHGETSP